MTQLPLATVTRGGPQATSPSRGRAIRAAVAAFLLALILPAASSVAVAKPAWTGKLELQNINDGASSAGEQDTAVYGADDNPITGTGNGKNMVWCDTADSFGQQYPWAKVRTNGLPGADIKLVVDDNNSTDSNDGTTDTTGGCGSDLYLPEDVYTIGFQEATFDNHDGQTNSNGEPTFADDQSSSSNGGSDELADDLLSADEDHLPKDNDDLEFCNDTNRRSLLVEWDLREDEGPKSDVDDSSGVDDDRFPEVERDVIDEGPHEIKVDLDQFAPTPQLSGNDLDNDSFREAAAVCISSKDHFRDDNWSGWKVSYGNAVPVQIMASI